jgi:hypothetical protein
MPPQRAAIPPVLRKTLLEWIESDDGNTPTLAQPAVSPKLAALHAHLFVAPDDIREPIAPPPGLPLAPLG